MNISARLCAGITTGSAEATRALAAEFAATLPPDTTLALHGDMGVGKTTFVQGLARGLGVHEQVTSPTFAIYSVHRGAGRTLVHLDAYRLEDERQVESLLLDEFLVSPWVLAVEWPDKIAGWIPANALHLTLSIVEGDRHCVRLQ
ncbi:MAG: tRNA (adenosine(37)-N6)-threonylcarbamoyltransferase complex ATPase subunit type 1 TsaE [Opitutus sp.]|nr:tRNA (adenosine(37)-N6)-threonylcarbamoyltransferase complex ATPase subunit type 1 TsaE [Opitutus sp.]